MELSAIHNCFIAEYDISKKKIIHFATIHTYNKQHFEIFEQNQSEVVKHFPCSIHLDSVMYNWFASKFELWSISFSVSPLKQRQFKILLTLPLEIATSKYCTNADSLTWVDTLAIFKWNSSSIGRTSMPLLPFNKHKTKYFWFGWTKTMVCINTLKTIFYVYIFWWTLSLHRIVWTICSSHRGWVQISQCSK